MGLVQEESEFIFEGGSFITDLGTEGVVVALVTEVSSGGLLRIGRTRLSLVRMSFILSVDFDINAGEELADIFRLGNKLYVMHLT